MSEVQATAELEAHYNEPDPWGYERNPDDARRRNELLSLLPTVPFQRVLDIGCGDGFVTFSLPGDQIVGVDLSEKAIKWAGAKAERREDSERFRFVQSSFFDLPSQDLGQFDLIVITGLLYPQYIGKGAVFARMVIDYALRPGGFLVSCHIENWSPPRFSYNLVDIIKYPYRDYTHVLEVLKK